MVKKSTKPNQQKPMPSSKAWNTVLTFKIATYLIFISIAFYLTAIYNKDLLLKLDELSLFLNTRLFFIDHLKEPAGMLSYFAAFLNQFFYYPFIGSGLFILSLIAVQLLTVRTFKISERYFLISFLPSVALLLLLTQLDYVIYEFIANGYAFMNILGLLAAYGSLMTFKSIKAPWLKILFAVCYLPIIYPIAGFYALLAAVLMLIAEIGMFFKQKKKNISLVPPIILILSLIAVPLYSFEKVYQLTLRTIYTAGLPEFEFVQNEMLYWLPVLLIIASVLFFSISPLFSKQKLKPATSVAMNSIAGVAFAMLLFIFSNKDENFHKELAIDHALLKANFKEVLKIERHLKGEPSRDIVLTSRLALQKMHKAGDLMFTIKEGNKKQHSKRRLTLWSYAAQTLFYQYGMINDCYRWAMEDMARFGPKVYYLRYMVKCALLNNEPKLADKYNSAIMHTLFHKQWAKKYQQYIDHPDRVKAAPEFKSILPYYSFPDDLVADSGNLEDYLLDRLISIKGGQLELLELSMQAVLLVKDADRFWPFFNLYLSKHDRIPVHYQEAALLFAQLDKSVDISHVPFDESIIDQFNRVHNDPNNKRREYFKEHYGNTYWYYAYYVK